MAARDLAIGLLLGGGGSQGENIIQYIVDNSVYVDTVTINDAYHYDMRLMYIDNRGISWTCADKALGKTAENMQHNVTVVSTGNSNMAHLSSVVSMTFMVQWLIAYENNIPIYANSAYISWRALDNPAWGMRIIDGVSQTVRMYTTILDVDLQNITKNYNSLTFYMSMNTASQGSIYTDTGSSSPTVTVPIKYYHYDEIQDEYGDMPQYVRTDINSTNLYLPSNIYPSSSGSLFYTNMSVSELNQKIYDIIVAINEDIYHVQTTELVVLPPPQPT